MANSSTEPDPIFVEIYKDENREIVLQLDAKDHSTTESLYKVLRPYHREFCRKNVGSCKSMWVTREKRNRRQIIDYDKGQLMEVCHRVINGYSESEDFPWRIYVEYWRQERPFSDISTIAEFDPLDFDCPDELAEKVLEEARGALDDLDGKSVYVAYLEGRQWVEFIDEAREVASVKKLCKAACENRPV